MLKHFILALMIVAAGLRAQTFSHPLRAVPGTDRAFSAPDTLRVLAIMVQFQTDNDSRTSGNGQFDLSSSTERIIDAPPHDSAYVADHFAFAHDYFRKASNGKQSVRATVLGPVITLKKAMKEYAPVSGNLPLGQLLSEAWTAADSIHPGFPFASYDLFVVVHAGVGRDIDLRAALGYDPTPLDLPSLYFDQRSLTSLFGGSFSGFPVNGGAFRIPNSALLPETEVRRIPSSVGEDFVLKLGLNGLVAATIGSRLGLPDLFDTKTGKSGIGRFGLMDGQAIFSFSGICPPEPNAWEKAQLGWNVVLPAPANGTISLPAVSGMDMDTVYRIPLSAGEYFLLENRHRDVSGNGQTVTMRYRGEIITRTFQHDTSTFSNTVIDSVYGTVLSVEEPEWSLPGYVKDSYNFKGGALIWHIDETVIAARRSANSINADATHRGVDLEEADGSQDIGQSYDSGSPSSGTEDGWEFDYWFSGNEFPKYKNEFSETTIPNSLSNTFAHSFVTIDQFSATSPRMTLRVQTGSPSIALKRTIKRASAGTDNNDGPVSADINGDGVNELIYTSGDSIFVLKNDLTPYLNNGTGLFSAFGGRTQPVVVPSLGDAALGTPFRGLAGRSSNRVYLFPVAPVGVAVMDSIASFLVSGSITTPLLYESLNNGDIQFGTDTKQLYALGFDPASVRLVTKLVMAVADTPRFLSRYPGITTMFSRSTVFTLTTSQTFDVPVRSGAVWSVANGPSNVVSVVFGKSSFQTLGVMSAPRTLTSSATSAFALADVDHDGTVESFIGTANGLYGVNQYGVVLENYPLPVKDGGAVTGSPLIVKRKGTGETLLLFGSTNGHLYCYTSAGKMVDGFPLQTGGLVSTPVLIGERLAAASTDSNIYVWQTNGVFDTTGVLWGNYLADASHSNFMAFAAGTTQRSSELLPVKKAYNWPNPVYSGTTNIRYYIGKTAAVTIVIVNQAGEKVAEFKGPGVGGTDNEVPWDISRVPSGIYFAQITATAGGEEAQRIVKIAVVK